LKRSFNPWLLVMLIVLGIFIFSQFNARGPSREIPYSAFTQLIDEGAVQSVVISRSDGRIEGQLKEPQQVQDTNGNEQAIRNFTTTTIVTDSLVTRLEQNVGDVRFRNPPQWIGFAISILPIIILIGFFWFVFMRAQGGPNQVMQFGQSRARTYGRENKVKTLFNDVAGHKEAKQ
jgi:cell division protease FtsH